jgi:hypothetical protein
MNDSEMPVHPSIREQEDDSERMMSQAWIGLRRVGQPVVVGVCLGRAIVEISEKYANSYHGLIVPSLAWPMVGLSIASCVNLSTENLDLSIRNYVYYALIGCLASIATISSLNTQFFFEQLNDGILKGVFSGTLVPRPHNIENLHTPSYLAGVAAGLALGLNVTVGFHTLYASLQRHVFKLAFKTGCKN